MHRPMRNALDDAVASVQTIRDAAVAEKPDAVVLCHGGPIADPGDVRYVLANTEGVAGFFGASSIERLPTEVGIREQVEALKAAKG